MKYVIDTTDAKLTELLYQGFVVGGAYQEKKSMTIIRLEAKLLDKFEAISQALPEEEKDRKYPSGDPVRKFEDNKFPEMLVTLEERDLLIKYVGSVPWVTKVAREIVKVYELLESAPERADTGPKLVEKTVEAEK